MPPSSWTVIEGRVDARLGVGMGSLDVEDAGSGRGDDGARALRRAVAPVDGGCESAVVANVLASVKVATTVAAGVQRRCWEPKVSRLRRSARRRR